MTDDVPAGGLLAAAWHPHHIDHLAPWCELLRAPLAVDGRAELAAAARPYPAIRWTALAGTDARADFTAFAQRVRGLAPRVLLISELFERWHLRELFGGRTAPRIVYVPHGFSEKRQGWARETAYQDVAVLYGEHARDQLTDLGVAGILEREVVSGNLRHAWHRRHHAHFRAQLGGLAASPRADRTVLYAPTWTDAIGSSSFFDAFVPFVNALPARWRMIAKLHPHLERHAPVVDALETLARGHDVHLVRGSPLTFPFLELADVYIGDMSALAYDYLAFGRPMFFTHATRGGPADASDSRLFACGTVIAPERYAEFPRIVDAGVGRDEERHGEARRALDRYTHAPFPGFDALARAVDSATDGPAPAWLSAGAALP